MGRRKTIKLPSKIRANKSISRRQAIEKLGHYCYWCKVFTDDSVYNFKSPRATTIDHRFNKLDPRRKGNDNNIVIACFSCNQARSVLDEIAFRKDRKDIRISHHAIMREIEPVESVPVLVEVKEKRTITCEKVGFSGPKIVIDVPLSRWQKIKRWIKNKYEALQSRLPRKLRKANRTYPRRS